MHSSWLFYKWDATAASGQKKREADGHKKFNDLPYLQSSELKEDATVIVSKLTMIYAVFFKILITLMLNRAMMII